jgi:hypothetical protein
MRELRDYFDSQAEKVRGFDQVRIVLFDDISGQEVGSSVVAGSHMEARRYDILTSELQAIDACAKWPPKYRPMFRLEPVDGVEFSKVYMAAGV